MNKAKRAKRRRPTAEQFADFMALKTLAHLAKMAPQEKAARLEAFHRGVDELRATRGRARRRRVSRVSSRGR
jgi:hypothetical protein